MRMRKRNNLAPRMEACSAIWIQNGKEYKEISLQYNDWWNWIIPLDYQKAFKHAWFDTMRADKRFDVLFERLDKCVVCREISTN